VAVMFPGDLLQQPTTPVQKAENIARKPTMNSAITDLPISVIIIDKYVTLLAHAFVLNSFDGLKIVPSHLLHSPTCR